MAEGQQSAFSVLRGLIRQQDTRERCELCAARLASEHQHAFEPAARKLICTCDACAVLFHEHGETKYKRVPRRIRGISDFQISDAQWNDLMIPIGVAFFVQSSVDGELRAFYPSPAGATESTPSFEAWGEIVALNPVLAGLIPDVEALLANRLDQTSPGQQGAYYIAPIDKCYELTGLVRSRWRGFSGGAEVWKEIAAFFRELNNRAHWKGSHA